MKTSIGTIKKIARFRLMKTPMNARNNGIPANPSAFVMMNFSSSESFRL